MRFEPQPESYESDNLMTRPLTPTCGQNINEKSDDVNKKVSKRMRNAIKVLIVD